MPSVFESPGGQFYVSPNRWCVSGTYRNHLVCVRNLGTSWCVSGTYPIRNLPDPVFTLTKPWDRALRFTLTPRWTVRPFDAAGWFAAKLRCATTVCRHLRLRGEGDDSIPRPVAGLESRTETPQRDCFEGSVATGSHGSCPASSMPTVLVEATWGHGDRSEHLSRLDAIIEADPDSVPHLLERAEAPPQARPPRGITGRSPGGVGSFPQAITAFTTIVA